MEAKSRSLGVFEIIAIRPSYKDEMLNVARLEEVVNMAVSKGVKNLCIDFSNFPSIDESLTGTVKKMNKLLLHATGRLAVLSTNGGVTETLDNLGVSSILRIYQSENEISADSKEILRQTESYYIGNIRQDEQPKLDLAVDFSSREEEKPEPAPAPRPAPKPPAEDDGGFVSSGDFSFLKNELSGLFGEDSEKKEEKKETRGVFKPAPPEEDSRESASEPIEEERPKPRAMGPSMSKGVPIIKRDFYGDEEVETPPSHVPPKPLSRKGIEEEKEEIKPLPPRVPPKPVSHKGIEEEEEWPVPRKPEIRPEPKPRPHFREEEEEQKPVPPPVMPRGSKRPGTPEPVPGTADRHFEQEEVLASSKKFPMLTVLFIAVPTVVIGLLMAYLMGFIGGPKESDIEKPAAKYTDLKPQVPEVKQAVPAAPAPAVEAQKPAEPSAAPIEEEAASRAERGGGRHQKAEYKALAKERSKPAEKEKPKAAEKPPEKPAPVAAKPAPAPAPVAAKPAPAPAPVAAKPAPAPAPAPPPAPVAAAKPAPAAKPAKAAGGEGGDLNKEIDAFLNEDDTPSPKAKAASAPKPAPAPPPEVAEAAGGGGGGANSVFISSSPPTADILENGKVIGTANRQPVQLAAGKHALLLRKGSIEKEIEVEVIDGKNKPLFVKLR
jgi:anti-anti-sigma regulatory factor